MHTMGVTHPDGKKEWTSEDYYNGRALLVSGITHSDGRIEITSLPDSYKPIYAPPISTEKMWLVTRRVSG